MPMRVPIARATRSASIARAGVRTLISRGCERPCLAVVSAQEPDIVIIRGCEDALEGRKVDRIGRPQAVLFRETSRMAKKVRVDAVAIHDDQSSSNACLAPSARQD